MVMGGVVCRFSDNQDKEERRTLTPDIIKALADEKVFIVIDPDDIGNKSKASLLAKGLVCFQVSWVALEVRRLFRFLLLCSLSSSWFERIIPPLPSLDQLLTNNP